MAEPPRIKRYALVPDSRDGSVTRFHLARRLERMEQVAGLERREGNGAGPAQSPMPEAPAP
jgi:hypothetical protein